MQTSRKEHWSKVYQDKTPNDVSWYQTQPTISLRLIEGAGIAKDEGIIDVGGGASVLVDFLLSAGFTKVTVLDVSGAALAHARKRLGGLSRKVEWVEADVTEFKPSRRFALWHDRAVFHFLTEKADRRKYVETLKQTVTPEGHLIIATFASDGPLQCSGLEVARYDSASISAEMGTEFQLVEDVNETHFTPWQTEQKFAYFRFVRKYGEV